MTLLPDEPLLFFPEKTSLPQRFALRRQLAEGAEPFWGLLSPLDAPEIVILASDSHSWTELRELGSLCAEQRTTQPRDSGRSGGVS